MVTTYKHGLRLLTAAFLATSLGSCTYNEDDLRGVDAAAPTDTAPTIDSPVVEVDAGPRIDTGPAQVGMHQDGGGIDVQVDAPMIDVSIDVGIPRTLDAPGLDLQSLDTQSADVPITVIPPIDAAPIDVAPTEAGRIDSPRG